MSINSNHISKEDGLIGSSLEHIQNNTTSQDNTSLTHLRWSEKLVLEPNLNIPDLVCFSHLRWDFVYQRPQHLLSRCAKTRRVFVVEEPLASPDDSFWLDVSRRECGVWVVIPYLPEGLSEEQSISLQQQLLNELFAEAQIQAPILWYYTPMAVPFTHHLPSSAVVYDCMDELSAFKGAHPQLQAREAHLFKLADLVFTGGRSLYEAKQHQHPNVYAFPSSIDAAHFAQARGKLTDPADQADIPHPRMGFYGVVDERMDLDLLAGIAEARPDWHLVIVGPIVKIDPAIVPRHPNIHYLGGKSYQELPIYLAGWDVALLPFARNESTRFISPTKTPEYLAAGKPVVSTSIRDVVRPYGEEKLVHIADTVPEFVAAIASALEQKQTQPGWLNRVDAFLAQTSWDKTWQAMNELIEGAIAANTQASHRSSQQQPVVA
ncbi:glycosyltransferase family 1 protein [Oscillatoria sp. FACHB-1407]|uniref:glycosyltransferase family 1 protein n=1 Tax=Oscillatoria sp. FACHB-1407 TaxID=2692847 RepID=UPI001689F1E2|nr:glycosyltransferase family 1 protein [Oscillatoria sp. FACHB-1407]MBD2459566.1 glycosyltransferase family 1 protein [Oscillatoria sp. FACHB-1407]